MLAALSDFLWGQLLVVLLVGSGLFFTVASRFVQFRYFGRMFAVLALPCTTRRGMSAPFRRWW
jgi:AGCS family alanine or glycine:cation symporter